MTRTMAMQRSFAKYAASAIWQALRRFIGNRKDGTRGVAVIEFAIIAPILVILMVCTIDLALGIYRKMQVQNAAQAGAQYAMLRGFNASSISSAVANATKFSGVSADPGPTQFCGCASSTGVSSAACNSTCSGGALAGTYVRVSAKGTYKTLLVYPSIPESFTFTAQSTVRIQ